MPEYMAHECNECGSPLTRAEWLEGNGYCYDCHLQSLSSESVPEDDE